MVVPSVVEELYHKSYKLYEIFDIWVSSSKDHLMALTQIFLVLGSVINSHQNVIYLPAGTIEYFTATIEDIKWKEVQTMLGFLNHWIKVVRSGILLYTDYSDKRVLCSAPQTSSEKRT